MPVLLALVTLLAAWPAAAQIRKADCSVTAEQASKDLEAAKSVLNRMFAVGYGPLIMATQGELRASAEAAAQAQTAAIPNLQTYINRLDDLRGQLRACAR